MSDKFWYMIVDFKIAERYYYYYICDSKRWNNIVTGICLLTSAASIATWYIWKQVPALWAILIAGAQIVSVLKPLFPFSERLSAGRYIYQDVKKLVIEAESMWGSDGSDITDNKFRQYLSSFEKRYSDTEDRFSTPDLFPKKKALHDKAQQDAIKYFESRYHTKAKEGV